MLDITQKNLDDVINSGKVVLVDFWAEWCMPCKMMHPVMEQINAEMDEEKVAIGSCDIQADPSIASKYGIMSIPAFLIFKDGKVMDQIIGVVKKNKLVEKIEEYKD